jgi:hypothetical protein
MDAKERRIYLRDTFFIGTVIEIVSSQHTTFG